MGRVTEFIDFINRKKMPDCDQQKVLYTHISITEKLKKQRRDHRRKK